MLEKANAHAKLDYHLNSMAKMSKFVARYKNPSLAINTIVDSEAQKIMKNNQMIVESLLKIIILRGKKGLALSGH